MKRNLLFSTMALGMGLLSSCNQDSLENVEALAPVTMSVNLPAGMTNSSSRALPVAPQGHSLRCIMFVDYTADGVEDLRQEKISTGDEVNGSFRFSFTPKEADYTCYFWADYVGENRQDKYYNTTDLTNITYKVTDNQVFNNDALDAFYGTALAGTTAATLKRPFVKLTVADKKNETVSKATSVSVKYLVPDGFNVKNNTTSKETGIAMTDGQPFDKANSVWFYNYVFAGSDDNKLGDILMTVDEKRNTLKGEAIPLQANYETTASIDFSVGGDVDIDVDIDDNFEDKRAPKMGQFMQKDGTFSDVYDAEKSIAIVFATGAKGEDKAGNYGETFAGKKIWGYAMGLTSTPRANIQNEINDGTFPELKELNGETPWAANDYSGYTYTNSLIAKLEGYQSVLMGKFNDWKTANSLEGLNNVSSWYIPSSRQLLDLIGLSYGYAGGIDNTTKEEVAAVVKDEKLAASVTSAISNIEKNEGFSYFGNHSGTANIMSSYVRGGRIMAVQTEGGANETIKFGIGVTVYNDKTRTTPFVIRPVITIFELDKEQK